MLTSGNALVAAFVQQISDVLPSPLGKRKARPGLMNTYVEVAGFVPRFVPLVQ